MGEVLKYNVENQRAKIGPFLGNDGTTVLDGLTIVPSEIQLSKNGGAFSATAQTANPIYDKNGYYTFIPHVDDLDKPGTLLISVQKLGVLVVETEHLIVPESVHSALFDTSDNIGTLLALIATSVVGRGSVKQTITVRDGLGTPISQAEVWITTDEEGDNLIAGTRITDDFGNVTFWLDPGSYYVWRDHPQHKFKNPKRIWVTVGD